MSISPISSEKSKNFTIESVKTVNHLNGNKIKRENLMQSENQRLETQQILPKEKIQEVIESMNNFLEPTKTTLQFKLHEELNEYYVKVVNEQTDEVIREIPSKKLMDIYAAMAEYLGVLFDKKI